MRILLTVPSLEPAFGGPARKAVALGQALRALGAEVVVLGAANAPVAGADALPYAWRYHGTPWPRGLARVARAARAADVVHVLGLRDPVGTVAARAARAGGIPYLVEPVGMSRRHGRSALLKRVVDAAVTRRLVAAAARVIATAPLERDELVADGLAPTRVAVRPNGVEPPPPAPPRGALRARLGIPPAAPLVLALGRVAAKKGLVPLVHAIAEVPGAHAVVAGPDDRDGTRAAVAHARDARGVAARVHLLADGLWGAAREAAFADADLLCLYSRHENFGQVALEGAARGLPLLLSDAVGAAAFVGDAARIVPLAHPEGLAPALRALCDDAGARARMAAAGRAAAAGLDWASVAGRQLALYRACRR